MNRRCSSLAGAVIALCGAASAAAGVAEGDGDLRPWSARRSAFQPPEIEAPHRTTLLPAGESGFSGALPDTFPGPSGGGAGPRWRQNLFARFASDQKFLMTTWWPRESRRYGFVVPFAVASAGAAASAGTGGSLDLRWQRSLASWTSDGRQGVAEALSRLGDRDSALLIIGGVHLASRWAGNQRLQRATSLSAEALLSSGIYSSALKRLAGRQRPEGDSQSSFPSGHTMGAFAVAAVVSGEYDDRRWVPWVAYGSAGLIGLSRIGLGHHFPSDVLAGAALGQSLGRMVTVRDGGGESGPRRGRFQPLFEPRNGGVGLAYGYSWNGDRVP